MDEWSNFIVCMDQQNNNHHMFNILVGSNIKNLFSHILAPFHLTKKKMGQDIWKGSTEPFWPRESNSSDRLDHTSGFIIKVD